MLTGQAKKEYQRKYMRKRRGSNRSNTIGLTGDVRPIDSLRQLIKGIEDKTEEKPTIYNPSVHKPGDKVLMKHPYTKKLVETIIPGLDNDGNPMPNYD